MKMYEAVRLALEPVLPPLYKHVRRRLGNLIHEGVVKSPKILDVGGRKSPYTIGLAADITLIDLPRKSEVQIDLGLGVDDQILDHIRSRRSNISEVVVGDMTCSNLPDDAFDVVVSVEVLEHVEQDELFVSEVSRVLKPDGIFLMTTPNGDWVENKNPDHKRHYKYKELKSLLNSFFSEVTIEYAIAGGRFRKLGLASWSASHPIRTASSIFGNIVNSVQSAKNEIKYRAKGTHHLIALAVKKDKVHN